jgi:NADH:ubiquinone oxidoreductase subunit E
MRIIGCDLHARQQTLAMLDTETKEVVNLTLMHDGNVREFYSQLPLIPEAGVLIRICPGTPLIGT